MTQNVADDNSIQLGNNNITKVKISNWSIIVNSGGQFTSSDIRLKKDLKLIEEPLNKIKELNGYNFTWKKNDKKDIGLIAQEVEKVIPNAVIHDSEYKQVCYTKLIPLLLESVKEQQKIIQKQNAKIDDQQKIIQKQNFKIDDQNIKINNLENIINYNKSNIDLLLKLYNEISNE